jgi:hypothetical protein
MKRDRRKTFRIDWHSPATIYIGKLSRPCILSNFSNSGAKITGIRAMTIPDQFTLRITPRGRIHICQVIWRTDDALGVQFTEAPTSMPTEVTAKRPREPVH